MARRAGRRSCETKAAVGRDELGGDAVQHKAVEVETAQRGFNAQHKTSGNGKPALMASQQLERTAELQDPEVPAELNQRVRECERKCFAGGRLGSIPQACARVGQ
jgi:hypothetical protein